MKRLTSLFLAALLMILSLPSAAAEAHDLLPATRSYPGLSDVSGAWCEEAVQLCYESGLLSGTSDTTFSPNSPLTYAQLIVLSARLHHILNGGDGTLPQAPEGYGSMSITCADGTPAPFQKKDLLGSCVIRQADESYRPELLFPEDLAADYMGETFQITIQLDEIRRYTGTMACFLPYADHPSAPQAQKEKQECRLTISLEGGADDRIFFDDLDAPCLADDPPWTRDAVYYMEKHDLASPPETSLARICSLSALSADTSQPSSTTACPIGNSPSSTRSKKSPTEPERQKFSPSCPIRYGSMKPVL